MFEISFYTIEVSAMGSPTKTINFDEYTTAREAYKTCDKHVGCHVSVSVDGKAFTPGQAKAYFRRKNEGGTRNDSHRRKSKKTT